MGSGSSECDLDVLLFSNQKNTIELLLHLRCQKEDPIIDSHHDALVSSCTIPCLKETGAQQSPLIVAPRLENRRHKIVWSQEGIASYEEITSKLLPEIRKRWLSSTSVASNYVLLQSTNFLLSHAASISNKGVALST